MHLHGLPVQRRDAPQPQEHERDLLPEVCKPRNPANASADSNHAEL